MRNLRQRPAARLRLWYPLRAAKQRLSPSRSEASSIQWICFGEHSRLMRKTIAQLCISAKGHKHYCYSAGARGDLQKTVYHGGERRSVLKYIFSSMSCSNSCAPDTHRLAAFSTIPSCMESVPNSLDWNAGSQSPDKTGRNIIKRTCKYLLTPMSTDLSCHIRGSRLTYLTSRTVACLRYTTSLSDSLSAGGSPLFLYRLA